MVIWLKHNPNYHAIKSCIGGAPQELVDAQNWLLMDDQEKNYQACAHVIFSPTSQFGECNTHVEIGATWGLNMSCKPKSSLWVFSDYPKLVFDWQVIATCFLIATVIGSNLHTLAKNNF
jgi:hypothetical protein